MTNEDKIKEYRKRQILRYSIIILSFLVVVLESLALFKVISYLWGLIPFVISCVTKYYYEKPNKEKYKI